MMTSHISPNGYLPSSSSSSASLGLAPQSISLGVKVVESGKICRTWLPSDCTLKSPVLP
jgi:hypothetical protein